MCACMISSHLLGPVGDPRCTVLLIPAFIKTKPPFYIFRRGLRPSMKNHACRECRRPGQCSGPSTTSHDNRLPFPTFLHPSIHPEDPLVLSSFSFVRGNRLFL